MFEYIILGIVQGLAEWLPISSEGFIVLIQNTFYQSGSTFDFIGVALFLHIGTFLAAIVYFKKDVKQILSTLWNFKKANLNDKKLFIFYSFKQRQHMIIHGSINKFWPYNNII